jgi:hypothetical protein
MFARKTRSHLFCSFCRKSDKDVAKLIAGPGVHICDACVDACNAILAGRKTGGFAGWETLTDKALLAALAPSEATVEAVRRVLTAQIAILRSRGVSWDKIGRALGVSRQAAWERFS